ncbi:MAG: hypothetical protein J6W62_08360 [Spirochaetia bacterium]|nr:hypothetical protein [Spirochaetia bacterium]
MNKLSFELKKTRELRHEYDYPGFLFLVDGKPLVFDDYTLPDYADFLELLDQGVIIARCTCGDWFCSAIIAEVKEINDHIIQWTLVKIQEDEVIETFQFDKAEYNKVIGELERIARKSEEQRKL